MSEQLIGERCTECWYPSGEGHSPNCPNNQESDVVYYPKKESNKEENKKSNLQEIRHAYWKEHPQAKMKEVFIKAGDWAKDIEKNRMNLKEAQSDAWKVRREAVKMKAQMEMGNEGEERDVEILENMIHSGKAEQPGRGNYRAGELIVDSENAEKKRNQDLESVREKLKNIKG